MHKHFLLFVFASLSLFAQAQSTAKVENFILITLDGMRWQEVFGGVDTALVNDKRFNQNDSAGIMTKYWAATPMERRKKLMPFSGAPWLRRAVFTATESSATRSIMPILTGFLIRGTAKFCAVS